MIWKTDLQLFGGNGARSGAGGGNGRQAGTAKSAEEKAKENYERLRDKNQSMIDEFVHSKGVVYLVEENKDGDIAETLSIEKDLPNMYRMEKQTLKYASNYIKDMMDTDFTGHFRDPDSIWNDPEGTSVHIVYKDGSDLIIYSDSDVRRNGKQVSLNSLRDLRLSQARSITYEDGYTSMVSGDSRDYRITPFNDNQKDVEHYGSFDYRIEW